MMRGLRRPDLVCPYCYAQITDKDINFRCTGFPSPDGQVCTPIRDEVLQRHKGLNIPQPPVFDGNGRKSHAVCPNCKGESSYRICPRCHSTLPVGFGAVKSKLVAMIGARNSGKTVYMTVLIHELIHSIGAAYDVAVDGADDETRTRFGESYERELYQDGLLPQATRSAGVERRDPLVFHFTRSVEAIGGRNVRHNTLLSFFDTAGEDLNSKEAVEQNTRYLLGADGIILLLDPLQMEGARTLAQDQGMALPSRAPAADQPQNVLARITDLLRSELRVKQSGQIETPIAVAFAKLDVLWNTLPENSDLRRPSTAYAGEFDDEESLNVHYEVQRLLSDWGGRQIDQRLETDYQQYRFFGLSALGSQPQEDTRAPAGGINPHRVGDPLLWLLAELGVLPMTKVKR